MYVPGGGPPSAGFPDGAAAGNVYCTSAIAKTPVFSGKLTPLGLLRGVFGEFSGIGLPLKTPAMIVTASDGCARARTPRPESG